jgi:mono/diheme cytochrome c family protein
MKTRHLLWAGLSSLLLLTGSAAAADAKVDFETQVKPLLEGKCVNCHHSGALLGELNIENRAMAFKKRDRGPVILPGKPDSSALYLVLKMPPKNPQAMPPNGHRVSDAEMNLIYDWIKQGAVWPKGEAGVLKPTKSRPQ